MSMQKSPFKKEKLEDQIQEEVNRILRVETSDARLRFVSVTNVEVNKDYSVAKIFWDTFDSAKRGDAKEAITKNTGRIRSLLASTLTLRKVPLLIFVYDSQFDAEKKITDILEREKNKIQSPHDD
jgi:ribosome-binding factor A